MKFKFAAIFIKIHRKRPQEQQTLLNIGVLFPVRQQVALAAGTQSTTTILIIAGNAVFGGILL